MKNLRLKIVCPDGEIFSGEAKSVLVTTTEGELQILAGHMNFCAPLKTGRAKIVLESGEERLASVSGGFILVSEEETKIVAVTFEFAEKIDIDRAKRARGRAEEIVKSSNDEKTITIAKAKLARALARISVYESTR